MKNLPIPVNEWQRLLSIAELDLDFSLLEDSLQNLTTLAADIAGTPISLVNLIDDHVQWSVARHGIEIDQMPRGESVCQYTLLEDKYLEIPDLQQDDRFCQKSYVTGEPMLQYYFGVPLKTPDGLPMGALCVLDDHPAKMEASKKHLLQLIAKEITQKISAQKELADLRATITALTTLKTKLAHDIRGPIGGIVGIARLFKNNPSPNDPGKITEVFNMIENSGMSLISLADEILNNTNVSGAAAKQTKECGRLFDLKDQLEKLYLPMAQHKAIELEVNAGYRNESIDHFNHNLLQICGNLVSNAIKFTPANGKVKVHLTKRLTENGPALLVKVSDTGIGMMEKDMQALMSGVKTTTDGTNGEEGYGLGLSLVKHLVNKMNGTLKVHSSVNAGTTFEIMLPQVESEVPAGKTLMPFAVN